MRPYKMGRIGKSSDFLGLTLKGSPAYHTDMPKPLMTATEAAHRLGLDRKTLRTQARENRAPVQPVPGSKPPRWRRADVEAFLAGAAL